MNPLEYEKRIKENRGTLAATKDLLGINGKIGVVVRFLGSPIIAQNEGESSLFEDDVGISHRSREMPDMWLLDGPPEEGRNAVDVTNRIPAMRGRHDEPDSPEWTTRKQIYDFSEEHVGWIYEGLSRGLHLTIMFKEETHTLTVHWRGYLVFREVSGDLRAYVPGEDWEQKIDMLYQLAKPKERTARKEEEQLKEEIATQEKKSWLRSVIDRWGPQ